MKLFVKLKQYFLDKSDSVSILEKKNWLVNRKFRLEIINDTFDKSFNKINEKIKKIEINPDINRKTNNNFIYFP